jgi:hypothetical protein
MSKKGRCGAPYFRVCAVEEAIERKYKTFLLSATEQQAIRQTLLDRVSATTEAARQEARRHSRRLHELTSQQQKLVQLYYKDSISEDVLQAEQTRIQAERAAAERLEIAADREVSDIDAALRDALALIDQGTTPYLTGNPTERRLISLAIYVMLLISDPDAVQGKPTALYAALVPLARELAQKPAQNGHKRPEQAKTQGSRPQNQTGTPFLRSRFAIRANGGEGGIRTLERGFPRYAISSRARSAAPAPLLELRCDGGARQATTQARAGTARLRGSCCLSQAQLCQRTSVSSPPSSALA